MKRALFIGVAGSEYLYFAKYMTPSEDPWFDVRESKSFNNVLYYGADAVTDDAGETTFILDATGEKLSFSGARFFTAEKVGKPETPIKNAI